MAKVKPGRLMAVSMTEDAVVARTKTVTRRLGWANVRVGEVLQLARKVMGRRAGEPLVIVARVRVVAHSWERLDTITAAEVAREGLPMTPAEFVAFFCAGHGCEPGTVVHRIEWEYLDDPAVEGRLL